MDIACPCKAVTIRLSADPIVQFWCHCADCQKAHGAAYVAESLYPRDAVTAIGKTLTFKIKTTPRIACAACGTRLYAELGDIGMRGVNGYLIKDSFTPTIHINCSSANAPVKDGLQHYANMPSEYGGDGKMMDW